MASKKLSSFFLGLDRFFFEAPFFFLAKSQNWIISSVESRFAVLSQLTELEYL